jgi:hypothetical protein
MVPAFQNVFSFKKKMLWVIQIVFGTIWKPVRAEQKVISKLLITKASLSVQARATTTGAASSCIKSFPVPRSGFRVEGF